jgi:hypothetical protein
MRPKEFYIGALIAIVGGALACQAANAPASELSGNFKTGAYTLEGGGATLTCTSASGKYEVVKPIGSKWEEQVKSNPGQDLLMNVEKWSGCKVKTTIVNVLPTMKACELHMQDETPEKTPLSKGNISVVTECTAEMKVLFMVCVLALPRAGNAERHEVKLENKEAGEDLLMELNLSGLAMKPNGAGCMGVKETSEGKLKTTAIAEGVIHL